MKIVIFALIVFITCCTAETPTVYRYLNKYLHRTLYVDCVFRIETEMFSPTTELFSVELTEKFEANDFSYVPADKPIPKGFYTFSAKTKDRFFEDCRNPVSSDFVFTEVPFVVSHSHL